MSVQLQYNYVGDYHRLDDENASTVLLRSAVPFATGSINHIARATLPVVTDSPSGKRGLSDLVLFDLVVFNESWGRWGIAPVLLFPTAGGDAEEVERFKLIHVLEPLLGAGRIKVYSVDSIAGQEGDLPGVLELVLTVGGPEAQPSQGTHQFGVDVVEEKGVTAVSLENLS